MPAQRKATAAKTRRGRTTFLDEAAWIEAALEILIISSIDAVGVEPLAKQLGVTKGSFYWHFKDRPALLRAILRTWRQRATMAIIERLEHSEKAPIDRLRHLMELPYSSPRARQAAQIDLAIRAWARRDELAAAAVQEVDRQRLSYIASQLRMLGFKEDEADVRAYLMYASQFAESLFATGESQERRSVRLNMTMDELTSVPRGR